MPHATTRPTWNGVQDSANQIPARLFPPPAGRASRILVASVEPFVLWTHRWGRPVAGGDATADGPLASSDDGRTVAVADADARAAGVQAGMTIAGAQQRLPALTVLPSAGPEVDAAWDAFLNDLHDLSPRLAPLRTGVVAFPGDAHDAAAFAERSGARVGGAGTIEEAWLLAYLSEPGRARVVADDAETRALLDVAPTYLLGGLGLSSAQRERLAWLGIETVGALRRWTPAQLVAYLGEEGRALLPVLHGPRTGRVPVRLPPEVLTAEHAFDDPAREPAEIEPVLERLLGSAADRLGERSAERVRIVASASGLHSEATRRAKAPLRDPARLLRLARLALDDTGLVPLGIDELRLELSGLARRSEAGELWPQRRRRELAAHAVHARFPGQARTFALHDPEALRSRLRWRLLDLGSGEPLPWHETDHDMGQERRPTHTTTDGMGTNGSLMPIGAKEANR